MKYWDWWTERKGESDSIMKKVSTRCHTLWPISQPIYPSIHPSTDHHVQDIIPEYYTTLALQASFLSLTRFFFAWVHIYSTHIPAYHTAATIYQNTSQPGLDQLCSDQLNWAQLIYTSTWNTKQYNTIQFQCHLNPNLKYLPTFPSENSFTSFPVPILVFLGFGYASLFHPKHLVSKQENKIKPSNRAFNDNKHSDI